MKELAKSYTSKLEGLTGPSPWAVRGRGLLKKVQLTKLRDGTLHELASDPRNPEKYESLAFALLELGDSAGALRALTSLAEISPRDAALASRAGFLLLCAGFHEQAVELNKAGANFLAGLAGKVLERAFKIFLEDESEEAVGAALETLPGFPRTKGKS